jgi:NAD(P)-dependent dehydrogenase (short-subunit alcohol dehydrogenase family)
MKAMKAWTASEIPDQTGRMAVVTGASSGIGLETAAALAAHGATVILACRNARKAEAAVQQIRGVSASCAVQQMQLDLASLASIERFATELRAAHDHLDLLINNAGVMMPPLGRTEDGLELQLGCNHLGHFALTGRVLDLLQATPGARVVTVSSIAHRTGRIDLDNLNAEKGYDRMAAYGQSKLANLLFTFELQRRLTRSGSELIALAAHPGWTATDLQRHTWLFRVLNPLLAQTPARGALPTLRAAVDPDARGGDYFGPRGLLELRGAPVRVGTTAAARNEALAGRLWQASEELTGVRFMSDAASD